MILEQSAVVNIFRGPRILTEDDNQNNKIKATPLIDERTFECTHKTFC